MDSALTWKINGFRPLYVSHDGTLWVSNGFQVYQSKDGGASFSFIGEWQSRFIQSLQDINRILRRLFRSGFHSLVPLSDGSILGLVRGAIVRSDPGTQIFRKVFDIPRRSCPLNLCVTPEGRLYFGEYFNNPERNAVQVYGSEDGGETWDIVYTFGERQIRHIHGIFYDEYRKGCWVLTGDIGQECRIAFTDDNFRTLATVFSEGQRTRAVSLISRPTGLIVPTDTPLEQNFIQWIDLKNYCIEQIVPLPGSAFYTGMAGDYLLVSTVVEPGHVNRCRYAILFVSKDDGHTWSELYRQKKDIWPMRYFQYGALMLPSGKSFESILYAGGRALSEVDENLMIWDLRDAGAS